MITISYWWVGVISYALCHVTHILLWHLKLFKPGLPLLLLIFFGIPGMVYLVALVLGLSFEASLAPLVTHVLLSASYFAAYPAIQASSPTLVILDALYRKSSGFSPSALMALFSLSVVTDRLSDLEKAGLIIRRGTEYELTLKGRGLANLFSGYRKLLGYAPGAG